MSKHVLIPIADGSEEIELVVPADVLRRAGAHVTIASIGSMEEVRCSRDVKIVADALLTDCLDKTYDLIVLPGAIGGVRNLRDCAPLIEMLKKQYAEGRWLAAICAAASYVFAYHHIADDCEMTCYTTMLGNLAKPVDAPVHVDKNVITSQGPGTAIAFSIKIAELLYGKQVADQLAAELLVN